MYFSGKMITGLRIFCSFCYAFVIVCEGKVSFGGGGCLHFTSHQLLRAGATTVVVNAVEEQHITNIFSLYLPLLLFSPTCSLNNRDYIQQIYLPNKPCLSNLASTADS